MSDPERKLGSTVRRTVDGKSHVRSLKRQFQHICLSVIVQFKTRFGDRDFPPKLTSAWIILENTFGTINLSVDGLYFVCALFVSTDEAIMMNSSGVHCNVSGTRLVKIREKRLLRGT